MSLHSDIMNLAVSDKVRAELEGAPKGFYLLGHRDARHGAAELAQQADAELTRLRAENDDLRGGIHAARTALALVQAECERLRVALKLIHGQDEGNYAHDIAEARAIARCALTGAAT